MEKLGVVAGIILIAVGIFLGFWSAFTDGMTTKIYFNYTTLAVGIIFVILGIIALAYSVRKK